MVYRRNPEKERLWQQESYWRNREKILARKRAAYDPERKKTYYQRTKDRHKERRDEHYRNNKHSYHLRARLREQRLVGMCEVTPAQWRDILDRHGGKCLRCGTTEDLTRDHVVPLSKGGRDHPDNLQPLCRSCNSGKGVRDTDYRASAT